MVLKLTADGKLIMANNVYCVAEVYHEDPNKLKSLYEFIKSNSEHWFVDLNKFFDVGHEADNGLIGAELPENQDLNEGFFVVSFYQKWYIDEYIFSKLEEDGFIFVVAFHEPINQAAGLYDTEYGLSEFNYSNEEEIKYEIGDKYNLLIGGGAD